MNAKELYQKLEGDFDLAHCREMNWSEAMGFDLNEYISDNFKNRYMGLLADNTEEIRKVYTAVFLSEDVVDEIIEREVNNALLFVHHPMVWDIDNTQKGFRNISKDSLMRLKENQISVYALHTPLDRTGDYSTGVSLARALELEKKEDFYEYFGYPAGVIGTAELNNINELFEIVKEAVGHKVKLWKYGSNEIRNNLVAVIGGGGNELEALKNMESKGVNAFVTGVTRPSKDYPPALEAHRFAKEKGINIIGATHYSTESFACIAMVDYFENLGLESEFIPDSPGFNDMDYGMG